MLTLARWNTVIRASLGCGPQRYFVRVLLSIILSTKESPHEVWDSLFEKVFY